MGIQGLIPFLQKSSRKVEMSEFSGCTVAVDAYCWLHKGVFSCAEKLARGEDTDQYVHYCMKYINMLASYNIKVILVFDGCHLPAKAETEKTRRERREATKKKACELLRADKGEEARQLLRRCVDVTHAMAHRLILKARAANIDCIVAPFEADAQLAYLNLSGMAHFVITEDSDLLLFGCTKVVFKMDVGGIGLLVDQTMLPVAMKMRPEQFTLDKFRQMCILSGCDYLSSLPGIGLTKACKFVKLTSQPDISKILHKIGSYLNMPNLLVPEEYKYNFIRAQAMFRHQPVFDPQKRKVVPLTPVDEDAELHLPRAHPPDLALQLALGNVDPITLKVVDDWDPEIKLKDSVKLRSIWSSEYRKPAPAPPVKLKSSPPVTTYGKRLSVSTDDILPVANRNQKSEEAELEEMRAMWGLAKKSRLEKLNDSEENMVDIDELVDPSPPKLNPFQVTQGLSNIPLMPTTTLSRLTSPPQTVSKYFDSPSTPLSQQQISDKQSKPTTSLPVVISRYFADSSSPTVKNNSDSTPNGLTDKLSLHSPQPIIIPESPYKEEITPKKRKITIASSPLSKLNEMESSKSTTSSNSNKKGRSLLSALENEDEENVYKYSQPTGVTISTPSGLSCFKWKPLGLNDRLSPSQKSDKVSGEELILDTPPCSQETESQPVKSPYLEQARQVGLSKNKSPAMQTFLSKFKFEPKSKLKKN